MNDDTDFFVRFQRVMHSVLATRILLHVRQVLETDEDRRTCPSQLFKGVVEGRVSALIVEQKQG
jgi:hypothetical protein